MSFLRVLNYQLPWIFMMALITIQSQLSASMLGPALARGMDKVIHFITFGVLSWLMTRGLSNTLNSFIRKYHVWVVLMLGLMFATLDEIHQSAIPGRVMDFWDWISDICGVVLFMLWYKKRNSVNV